MGPGRGPNLPWALILPLTRATRAPDGVGILPMAVTHTYISPISPPSFRWPGSRALHARTPRRPPTPLALTCRSRVCCGADFWFLLVLMLLLVILLQQMPRSTLAAHELMPPPAEAAEVEEAAKRVLLRVATASGRGSSVRDPRHDSSALQPPRPILRDARNTSNAGDSTSGSLFSLASTFASSEISRHSEISSSPASRRATDPTPHNMHVRLMAKSRNGKSAAASLGAASVPYHSHLLAVACSRGYLPFRLVVLARTLFYMASGIFQTTALYFVTDHVDLAGLDALTVSGCLGNLALPNPTKPSLPDRILPNLHVFSDLLRPSPTFIALPNPPKSPRALRPSPTFADLR